MLTRAGGVVVSENYRAALHWELDLPSLYSELLIFNTKSLLLQATT